MIFLLYYDNIIKFGGIYTNIGKSKKQKLVKLPKFLTESLWEFGKKYEKRAKRKGFEKTGYC